MRFTWLMRWRTVARAGAGLLLSDFVQGAREQRDEQVRRLLADGVRAGR
jgi:hypothetical protein